MKKAPANMDLCVMIGTGTCAVLGEQIWTAAKAMKATPATTNKAAIRSSSQAYVAPPHCNASKSETTEETKKKVPIGSRRLTCSMNGADSRDFGSGSLSRERSSTSATPPMGKFM